MNERRWNAGTTRRVQTLRQMTLIPSIGAGSPPEAPRAAEARLALHKIHEGTYGTCDACGGSIPQARLRAKPEATRCIQCQMLHESGRSR